MLVVGAVALAIAQCKPMKGVGAPGGGGLPGTPSSCPSSIDEIASASWGLDAALEGRVKAGLSAAASLQEISGKIEGDVAAACGDLAKDLGATDADITPKAAGPGKRAEAACQAAVKVIGELKAKAKGRFEIKAKPARCAASMDAMASCAGKCDASVKPGSAKVECEGGKLSGECSGKCQGTCTVQAGAKCEGTCSGSCSGSCEAGFSGKCDGKCEGTCDGKNTKGKCQGTCDGKCTAGASGSCSGECKGQCSASCDVEAKGECSGTCTGSCSVEMKAPKCTGEVKPPQMSADCKASCDAQLTAKLECTPPSVEVVATGSADAQASLKLKAALSKHLPALLNVTMGMKGSVEKAAAGVQASIQGLQAAVQGGAAAALKVGPCVAAALKAQVDASASINVSVQASASASGSVGG